MYFGPFLLTLCTTSSSEVISVGVYFSVTLAVYLTLLVALECLAPSSMCLILAIMSLQSLLKFRTLPHNFLLCIGCRFKMLAIFLVVC